MCGILGGVFHRPVTDRDRTAFKAAVRSLAHRGPDAESLCEVPEANALLGFRRLAIIDLVTGDQPMATGAGHHIVFNGEIYNYRDVRRDLAAEGVRFRTSSDTEVLLQLLAHRGLGGLERLRGMWGFGFLDVPANELLLARDRLGVKQLYHAEGPDGFFFASEPKALLALPWISAQFDPDQLAGYFTFRCVPAPRTLFRGIAKLPPGTALRYDLRTRCSRLARYWTPPAPERDGARHMPIRQAVDCLESGFLEAVRRRLVADVPVGAFLSGGLDSSLVVAAMRRLGHSEIETFSATFPGSPDDESTFARRVAERFGTAHREAPARPAAFLRDLPRWTELNDDLVADASSLPLLGVSRLARASGCIVLLSGEGSDELFGGYGSYHKFVLLHRLAGAVPGCGLRSRLTALLHAAGLIAVQDLPRIREYFVHRRDYLGTAAVLGVEDLAELLGGARRGEELARATRPDLAHLGAFDFARRIPDDLLVRTDRATMGASVEARVPFLDHDFVELSATLPPEARAVPGISKVGLRLLALRWGVPYRTVAHRKIGFQIPLGAWFRGPLRPLWKKVLCDRLVPGIRYDQVARLYDAHVRLGAGLEEILWRIAALELWYRRWISDEHWSPALSEGTRTGATVAA